MDLIPTAQALLAWIRARFRVPAFDAPDLSGVGTSDAAWLLRLAWGVGHRPFRSLTHLMEAHGVRVFSIPVGEPKDTFSAWVDGEAFVFLRTDTDAPEARLAAARELGALVLRRDQLSGGAFRRVFASELLLPEDVIRAHTAPAPTIRTVDAIAKALIVPPRIIPQRMHQLGLINARIRRSLVLAQYRRRRCALSPAGLGEEGSQVLSKVLQALWAKGVRRRHIARDLGVSESELAGLTFGEAPAGQRGQLRVVDLAPRPQTEHLCVL